MNLLDITRDWSCLWTCETRREGERVAATLDPSWDGATLPAARHALVGLLAMAMTEGIRSGVVAAGDEPPPDLGTLPPRRWHVSEFGIALEVPGLGIVMMPKSPVNAGAMLAALTISVQRDSPLDRDRALLVVMTSTGPLGEA